MFSRDLTLAKFDADLFAAMEQEAQRQEEHIELIASENYTSPAVMEAQGSVLTNKYAEGYPGKRYYGGCEYVDVVEQLAIDRAKELFGADYANVQPHAGSQANSAVYLALLSAGDTILGMSLAHGGHLTHGASVSSSGKLYNAIQYGIDANGLIVARNEVAGRALAHNLGYEWQATLGNARPQMLVNVTPIGMTGGAQAGDLAFEADAIEAADTVFDVVAIPAETPLIVRGRAQGKRVITGLEVIAIQALEQFVLYTGIRPTDEQFHKAVAFARQG